MMINRTEFAPRLESQRPEKVGSSALMKEHGALERFQGIFSPFRLPIELTLRLEDCNGVSNAWYARPIVTICYEYIDDLRKNAPTETAPADLGFTGITPADAIFGEVFYVVAHEMGHAMFDLLDVSIFGRAEMRRMDLRYI